MTGPSADTERTASSTGHRLASLGPGQGRNPSFEATRRHKGTWLCRPSPVAGNEKSSLGTARLRCDPPATDARLSLTGTTPAGRRSQAWPLTATSAATEAVPDRRHRSGCGRAAGECPHSEAWPLPGDIKSRASRGPFCALPMLSKARRHLRPGSQRDGSPTPQGPAPFFPPRLPSQVAAGFLQRRGTGRGTRGADGFSVRSWILWPAK